MRAAGHRPIGANLTQFERRAVDARRAFLLFCSSGPTERRNQSARARLAIDFTRMPLAKPPGQLPSAPRRAPWAFDRAASKVDKPMAGKVLKAAMERRRSLPVSYVTATAFAW
jgi:hypothetical protein